MPADKSGFIQLDEKTEAVMKKKGYKVKKKISAGAFGEVFKAENVKRQEMNAVKIMHLEKVAKQNLDQKYLDREIKALIKIKHPNVLKVHDIFKAAGRLYIFMEFASNGTLQQQIKKADKGYLSERKSLRWFRQCVDALVCMHYDHHMAHRDIKPDNVLFDENYNAKLSDFGFAREYDPSDGLAKTWCGTPPFQAPEILGKEKYNPFLADVWSMGVMLMEMLNGCLPFSVSKDHRQKSLDQMKRKKFRTNKEAWEEVSDLCKDLVDSMFNYPPGTRPNIVAVRKHPWFA